MGTRFGSQKRDLVETKNGFRIQFAGTLWLHFWPTYWFNFCTPNGPRRRIPQRLLWGWLPSLVMMWAGICSASQLAGPWLPKDGSEAVKKLPNVLLDHHTRTSLNSRKRCGPILRRALQRKRCRKMPVLLSLLYGFFLYIAFVYIMPQACHISMVVFLCPIFITLPFGYLVQALGSMLPPCTRDVP